MSASRSSMRCCSTMRRQSSHATCSRSRSRRPRPRTCGSRLSRSSWATGLPQSRRRAFSRAGLSIWKGLQMRAATRRGGSARQAALQRGMVLFHLRRALARQPARLPLHLRAGRRDLSRAGAQPPPRRASWARVPGGAQECPGRLCRAVRFPAHAAPVFGDVPARVSLRARYALGSRLVRFLLRFE